MVLLALSGREAAGQGWPVDCNDNLAEDTQDIRQGISIDCNENSVPDSCELVPLIRFQHKVIVKDFEYWQVGTAGDFDGDGIADLAVTNWDTGTFAVHFGASPSDPTGPPFSRFVREEHAILADQLASGDLDGDGALDLLAIHRPTAGLVNLMGRGDGTFVRGEGVIPGWTVDSIAVLDLDGDLDQDVAAIPAHGPSVVFFLNSGEASFREGRTYTVAERFEDVTAADLDGDGDIDLALTSRFSSQVLRNDGGPYSPTGRFLHGIRPPPLAMDIDSDARTDVIAAAGVYTIACMRGLEGPALAEPALLRRTVFPGIEFELEWAAVGDFDGNGTLDLAGATARGETGFALYTVDAPAPEVDRNADGRIDRCEPLVGDCDADGILDATEIEEGQEIDCNMNGRPDSCDLAPEVSFEPGAKLLAGWDPRSIAVVDVDADGNLDIATADTASDALSVFLSSGDGGYKARSYPVRASVPNQESSAMPMQVIAADLDGDQRVDLATGNAGRISVSTLEGSVTIFWNVGEGQLSNRDFIPVPATVSSLQAADANGDGRIDLIAAHHLAPQLSVLLSDGAGGFLPPVEVATQSGVRSIVCSDLNRDGAVDVAAALDSQMVEILLGAGSGSFIHSTSVSLEETFLGMTAGDIDGDGDADLAGCQYERSQLRVLRNGGRADFLPAPAIVEVRPSALASFDVDGDGIQDVVSCGHAPTTLTDSHVSIRLGTSTGVLGPAQKVNVPGVPAAVAAGDMNRDGLVDFTVVQNPPRLDGDRRATVAVFLNRTSRISQDCNADGVPDSCEIALDPGLDCDASGTLDSCQIAADPAIDRDGDGIADRCEEHPFRRGDCDGDGGITAAVTDALFLLRFSFDDGPEPRCMAACDADGDGQVLGALTDAIYVLRFGYLGGPPPPAPFPHCGDANTEERLPCAAYEGC